MPEGSWLGAVYLLDEGGHGVVLRSLAHYRRRLATLGSSPEMEGAAMFAPLLRQQAARTIPRIDAAVSGITECLAGSREAAGLASEVPLIEEALRSYRADIERARGGGHGYFTKLVGDAGMAEDVAGIDAALERVGRFA